MSLLELWNKYFGDEEEQTPIFYVMHIPLPGDYDAKVEDAEVYISKTMRYTAVRLKLRLVPDDPDDQQTAYMLLSKRQYIDLLKERGIPRTNDVTVLRGLILHVKVSDRVLDDFEGVHVKLTEARHEEVRNNPRRNRSRNAGQAKRPRTSA